MIALKEVLTTQAVSGLATQFGGDDAVKHLAHFFGNTGSPYTIDFAGMIREVSIAKQTHDIQVAAAKSFIETLPPGRHYFTSSSGSLNHYITQGLSRNWFFAVGSYSTWGKGIAEIKVTGGKPSFSMNYEYHFVDRYNWDGGKKVQIPIPGYGQLPQLAKDAIDSLDQVNGGRLTVTDEFMARFHRQGLAQEFEMTAVLNERIAWRPAAGFIEYTVKAGDTLSKLAGIYLGDIRKWSEIHKLNKATVRNPDLIRVGQVLKIPA